MRITYNDKLNKLLNPYLESLLKEKSRPGAGNAYLFDPVHGGFGHGRTVWYIQ